MVPVKARSGERIAILGGSFNPPHEGHLAICAWLLQSGQADRVLAMPCYEHPFGKELAPFEDRLAMTRLALQTFGDKVEVSDLEKRLGGVSYTIRTVEYLTEHFPKTQFSLVVGSDIGAEKHKWKEFDKLEELVAIITIPRGEESHIPDVSATDIRARVASGTSLEGLVPQVVADYIREHRLYWK